MLDRLIERATLLCMAAVIVGFAAQGIRCAI